MISRAKVFDTGILPFILEWTMFRAQLRPGLDLRLLEERHAAEVFAVVDQNRRHLEEWLPWVDATLTVDDSLSFIRASLQQFAANEGFAAGIWKENRYIGGIGTLKIDWRNRKVEVGYWISRSNQGQGIVTDASRAVAERLGFKLDGTLRQGHLLHDRYHDLLVFGIVKRDWQTS